MILNENQLKISENSIFLSEDLGTVVFFGLLAIIGGSIYSDIKSAKNKEEKIEKEEKEKNEKENEYAKKIIKNINGKKVVYDTEQIEKIDNINILADLIEKDLKKLIPAIKSNPYYKRKIQENIKESLDDYNTDDKERKNEYKEELKDYKLIVRRFENYNDLKSWEIIDGSQEARICLSFILSDIKRVINYKYKAVFENLKITTSTGDGDEGIFEIKQVK